jgi:hypothetical protein
VIIVRWADDFIVGFETEQDACQFLAELRERFARFGLRPPESAGGLRLDVNIHVLVAGVPGRRRFGMSAGGLSGG